MVKASSVKRLPSGRLKYNGETQMKTMYIKKTSVTPSKKMPKKGKKKAKK